MSKWNSICAGNPAESPPWELFHENSKTSQYDPPLPTSAILARMADFWESLPYEGRARISLEGQCLPLTASLQEVILARATARNIAPVDLTLAQLATLLHCAYGVTRDNTGTVFPRPFRAVPSGGGLYPLEIYFHTTRVEGLPPGIFHFSAAENCLRLLSEGDFSRQLSEALIQPNLAVESSVMIFITAVFERSVFKYGDRGYRFVLLEAGHVGQNLSLVANGLGLGAVSVGGYFDRKIDGLLGIDGLNHSTVYIIGLGQNRVESGQGGGS